MTNCRHFGNSNHLAQRKAMSTVPGAICSHPSVNRTLKTWVCFFCSWTRKGTPLFSMILIQHFHTKIIILHYNELRSWFLDFSTSFFTENPIKALKPLEMQPELEKITTLDFFKYLAFSRDRPLFQEKRTLKNAGEI